MIRLSAMICAAVLACGPAAMGAPRPERGVPEFNVKGTCADAEKFGIAGANKDISYKGCLSDEQNAKDELKSRWTTFRAMNKQDCVEQARAPSPSYVEVLTCLEMYTDGITGGKTKGPSTTPPPAEPGSISK